MIRRAIPFTACLLTAALLGSCGYHVADRGALIPATVKTIAVPAFANATNRYKLTDQLPEAIKRELIARTRYKLVSDPSRADAVLKGTVMIYNSNPTVIDTTNNRAGVADLRLTLNVSLVERTTGKVLFNRPSFEVHESYEISEDPGQYFEESDTALSRVAKQAAQQVVTAILDNFEMTPEQFLDRLSKKGPESAYLFLGSEGYNRQRCRKALIDTALPAEDRENGFTRHDLDQIPMAAALDDARSLSLFASKRIVWLGRAEAALPRGKAAEADEDAPSGASDGAGALEAYLRDPTPGTVLVIDVSRYDFEGEDKARLERAQKFFSAVQSQVEFKAFSPEAARALAQSLAREIQLQLGLAELALLLEATGGDASRIAVEIEKLKLFVGSRKVTAADIEVLAPEASASNIFALVNALARGDRSAALGILDTLSRSGDYMPLALTFLATQFRMALTAREARLRNASEIQAHFTRIGARIWPERARQIGQTMEAFPKARLERAVVKLFQADRDLRNARPDDRTIMEEMILDLTAK